MSTLSRTSAPAKRVRRSAGARLLAWLRRRRPPNGQSLLFAAINLIAALMIAGRGVATGDYPPFASAAGCAVNFDLFVRLTFRPMRLEDLARFGLALGLIAAGAIGSGSSNGRRCGTPRPP